MTLPPPTAVLPHRDPFLFLDRCLACGADYAVAERVFGAEPLLAGHFPGDPIVPGVILIEALAQTLAYWALQTHKGGRVYLTGVDGARLRRPVRPGECARLEIRVERTLMRVVMARGEVTVDGERAVTVKLKGYLAEAPPA
ncbi:beta-hydroxyacyl-ACP dehydratase [Myxococcota bacterium]|nr:beta-hydroxyacyl-ACP dehydratase [Myxococcota bacterium]MBU1430944.1 beta-hydroxyacyl-ACP dehydratase [Myxococcota bacterium]MBU1897262.1 beta-hydroxyacyl-ACP dehydratase [Myxococcota bacterium]